MTDNLKLIVLAIVVAFIVGRVLQRRWSIANALSKSSAEDAANAPDTSAILSYYTAGHDLVNAGSGTVSGMNYTLYITGPLDGGQGDGFVSEQAIIYALELPFNTQAHLLGLSKSFGLDRLQFASFLRGLGMENIQLEGDFPDYFDVYATGDQGFEVRTVLEPDSMAFVVEYCRTHFWEIHDAMLYFAITDSSTGNEDFVVESKRFAESIRPALPAGSPGAPPVEHPVAYGKYSGPALACPLCQKPMELHDQAWFSCADHGVLLNGGDLQRLHSHQLQITLATSTSTPHETLTCPNCKHTMAQVQYEEGSLQIDSCTNCPFRWLDAAEVAKLSA